RFDWQNLINFGKNGLMPAVAALMVAAGAGLAGVAYCYVVINFIICLVALAATWKLLRLSQDAAAGKGLGLKAFFLYSLSSWFGSLAWIVTYQFDKIFLMRGVSLTGM